MRILTCVYCGYEYPQVLTDHLQQCEKHPMKRLRDEHAMLRKALIGLVGSDDPKELELLEGTIRMMPIPDVDRMNTINAIQALLQTSPVRFLAVLDELRKAGGDAWDRIPEVAEYLSDDSE